VKKLGGKKKQRLSIEGYIYNKESLESLQSLLLCLEVSLRSDAHNGGAWVREGDSQRFDLLLKPLGRLLDGHIFVEMSSTITYQSIIQGDNKGLGSVVDCLVSLASAAGDEQLWKPLNHSVLQAASNEHRAEVRKAGVTCLAALIRSIGEEYMVLVPECLPVLSELLEDSDEEIVGLAQECISLSEEFLGESLQDSLR
jgi:U3 small nucleolar RNA-associated protein 10